MNIIDKPKHMPSKRDPIGTLRKQAIAQLKTARDRAVIQAWMELQNDELCQTVPSLSKEQRLALIQVKLKEIGVDWPQQLTNSISPTSVENLAELNTHPPVSLEQGTEPIEPTHLNSSTPSHFLHSRTRAY